MSRLGKKDLFSPTLEEKGPASSLKLAASSVEGEVEKVMVMLTPQQVHALDRVCLEIRQTTGMKSKRSMVIRALIDGFLQTPISFKDAKTYEDINRKIMDLFVHG